MTENGKLKMTWKAGNLEFASREELDFHFWLEEARAAGIITAWSYQPRTFELAPKVTITETQMTKGKPKLVERHLLHDCVYTPDFLLQLGECGDLIGRNLIASDGWCWLDVKGKFPLHGDGVKFSLLQKWMYDKYGIYINKLVPVHFFEKTFVPRRAAYGKNGQVRACYSACRRLDELLNQSPPRLI